MEPSVTTRAALLLVLGEGPGYGLDLVRRVAERSGGRVRVSEARVYPALKALEAEGHVRAFVVVPRGRRGARARTYYDLTVAGVAASREVRALLRALAAGPPSIPAPTPAERVRMAERLRDAEELAVFAAELGQAARAARRSRA